MLVNGLTDQGFYWTELGVGETEGVEGGGLVGYV